MIKTTFLLSLFVFIGCNHNSNEIKEKQLELKEKELSLREKELDFQIEKHNHVKEKESSSNRQKKEKKLVYLFTANGGMIGYFSDGTVVGCPRCDFCKSNILAMLNNKDTTKAWDLEQPVDFDPNDESWVLVNYEWRRKVPQD